jgi:hypothetical protein
MSYPTTLDTFNDPVAGDPFSLSSTEASTTKITKIHDALEALEAKVGITSSAVTTSLDYRVLQGQLFIPFSTSGTVSTGTAKWVIPIPENWTLVSVTWRFSTPPTGAAFIMDINYDGVTACSTRPQTSATNSFITTAAVFSVTTLASGSHYLSGDYDQVGSTVAGAGLFGLIGVRKR